MCQSLKAGFLGKKEGFKALFKAAAQGSAQVAQYRLRKVSLAFAGILLWGCASTGNAPTKALNKLANQADAILISEHTLFVFDFGRSRFQKWPLSDGTGMRSCAITDTLQGNWSAPKNWLALTSPVQPFQPSQAISGPNGDFFLLDRIGKRLALYDTNAQFLSGFPLPNALRNRNLNRMEIYWTRDGQFSFLDLDEAKVWKYAEVRTVGGSGDWQLGYSLNLPMGLRACLWEPYANRPNCLGKRDSLVIVFDKYFNPTQDVPEWVDRDGVKPVLASADAGWKIKFTRDSQCGPGPDFYFSPILGGFQKIENILSSQPGSIPLQP